MVKMIIFVFLTFVAFVTADYYDHAAQMRKKTIERLKNLSDIPLNIAVTGGSGVGKSTLINTLRGLSASDFSAAAVGVVETTHKTIRYVDPKYSQFVYWDLPGCGTPDYSRNTYLSKVKFDTYDFFLIISAGRFTENDLWLADEIQKQNKQFFMIRNKINTDLQNEKRDHPERISTEVLNEIRDSYVKYFIHDTKRQKVPIYLISALLSDSTNWDLPNLVNDSIRESLRLK